MTPVSGDGVHQVAVGPVHAGVIESGHFRLHVVGERILAMDPRLFYKHRGLEQAACGHGREDALAYAQRACAACAVTNSVAYAQAVEEATGIAPTGRCASRGPCCSSSSGSTTTCNDIGAICAGVGFAPGTMAFAALKDRAQQINMRAFGHRFLFGTVRVGGGAVGLSAARRRRRSGSAARAAGRHCRRRGASSASRARCRRALRGSASSTPRMRGGMGRGRAGGSRRGDPRGRPQLERAPGL